MLLGNLFRWSTEIDLLRVDSPREQETCFSNFRTLSHLQKKAEFYYAFHVFLFQNLLKVFPLLKVFVLISILVVFDYQDHGSSHQFFF